jgi:hypothetical protein
MRNRKRFRYGAGGWRCFSGSGTASRSEEVREMRNRKRFRYAAGAWRCVSGSGTASRSEEAKETRNRKRFRYGRDFPGRAPPFLE